LWEPKIKCPKTVPTHLQNEVVWSRDPQVYYEVLCNQALNQMLFQWISIHAGPHT